MARALHDGLCAGEFDVRAKSLGHVIVGAADHEEAELPARPKRGRTRRSDIARHRCRRRLQTAVSPQNRGRRRERRSRTPMSSPFRCSPRSSPARTLRRIDDGGRATPFARWRWLAPLQFRLHGFHERDEHLGLDLGLLKDGNAHGSLCDFAWPNVSAAQPRLSRPIA